MGVARNLSWKGTHLEGGTPDPRMAAASLPSKVLGRKKIKKFGSFLSKMYLLASFGRLLPPLPLHGYAHVPKTNSGNALAGQKRLVLQPNTVCEH